MDEQLLFIQKFLPIVMANDLRLQVHTLSPIEEDGKVIFTHIDKTCSMCCIIYLLSYPHPEDLQ